MAVRQVDGYISGNTKSPMEYIHDAPPIKVSGAVVASFGCVPPGPCFTFCPKGYTILPLHATVLGISFVALLNVRKEHCMMLRALPTYCCSG